MKRFLIILLLLIFPLLISPFPSFAASPAPNNDQNITSNLEDNYSKPTFLEKLANWIIGLFIKDYDIPINPLLQQINFTEYSNIYNSEYENINSPENRSTSNNQQLYFKGQYINDVIKDIMKDKIIAKICDQKITHFSNDCGSDFKISCLARYFVEDNKTFLYQDQNGIGVTLSPDLIETIKNKSSDCIIIPLPNFNAYQNLYLNFFRVPPEYSEAIKNENATRVLRTPIPNNDQTLIPINPNEMGRDIKDQREQLDRNFVPGASKKKWDGLNSLRPQSWL
jgi:hypothetical protein